MYNFVGIQKHYWYDIEGSSCRSNKMKQYLIHIWNLFAWKPVLFESINRINKSLGKSMNDRQAGGYEGQVQGMLLISGLGVAKDPH